jgi:YD repeat-containing protein
LHRLTQETDPLTKNVTYAYDGNSRLTSRTDRLGRRRDYVYDSEGRVLTETWVNSGGGTADTQTYTYDAHGNVLTAANGNGAYTFSYDTLDRVTAVEQPFGQRLTFVYDAVGNRTRVEDSKGGVATSTYNAANLLTKREHTGQAPLRIDFTYTVRDQVETTTRYSDLAGTTKVGSSTYSYDAAARLRNLQHRNGSGTLFSNYTYTYDLAHRLETETYNGTTVTYTYDDTNQLTGDGSNSYSYDLNGNRTMTGYQTGTGNRLTNDGTWTYTYDDEGSTTKKSKGTNQETWTYGYDHRNQLVWVEKRATDGGTLQLRADYKYDVFAGHSQISGRSGREICPVFQGVDHLVKVALIRGVGVNCRV